MKLYKNTNWQEIILNEEKNLIPLDWKKGNVKESIYLKARIGWQGLKSSEFIKEGSFYCVTGQDFENNEVNWKNCYKVTEDRYNQDKKIQLQENDILITKDGTIGKFAKVKNIPLNHVATLNSGVFVSRAKTINQDFWFYILKSNLFFDFVNKQKSGSTIAHLNQGKFEFLEFLVPSEVEQNAIASLLSSQESIIQKTKNLIKDLEKRNQFMINELLSGNLRVKEQKGEPSFYKNPDNNWQSLKMNGENVEVPKDWDSFKLEKHITCNMGETILSANIKQSIFANAIPVISASQDEKYFGYIDKKIVKKVLRKGDLTICARGSIGFPRIVKEDVASTQTTIQVRSDKLDLNYLCHFFNANHDKFFNSTGGAVPQLTLGMVNDFEITQPKNKTEIDQILNVINSLTKEKQKYEKILEKEEKTFIFLLEELMSGRLRIKI